MLQDKPSICASKKLSEYFQRQMKFRLEIDRKEISLSHELHNFKAQCSTKMACL